MAEDLPKQDLLLKMLNMTTVEEDTMAVVAIRKANALLREAGWTWEKLLLGKIVVVADPFSSIKTPDSPKPTKASGMKTYNSPRPPPPPPPAYQAAPQPRTVNPAPHTIKPKNSPIPPQPKAPATLGIRKNVYPSFCYCCGLHVPSEKGYVFNPNNYTARAANKWVITCIRCNAHVTTVSPSPAPKKNNSWTAAPTPGPAPKLDSL